MTDTDVKILVPLDGSPLGDKVLDHLELLGSLTGASVRPVRVVADEAIDPSSPESYHAAQKALRAVDERLAKSGAQVQATLLVGDPAEKIIELAATWRPSFIAMSTHGRTGVERIVRGSVAERVLRGAEAPVLLVNPFTVKGRFETILVPLDGSSLAASILPLAARIARKHRSKVVLFHSVEQGASGADALITRREARDLLARYERFFNGLEVEVQLAGKQSPTLEILHAIDAVHADLVVLSTHGRTGVARWALGSVAEKVLRECRCPVLVRRAVTSSPDGALHRRHPLKQKGSLT